MEEAAMFEALEAILGAVAGAEEAALLSTSGICCGADCWAGDGDSRDRSSSRGCRATADGLALEAQRPQKTHLLHKFAQLLLQ